MRMIKISDLFNYEKGTLQSKKNIEGPYNFITASEEWKTHTDFTHNTEAIIFAAAAAGSLGRTHYVKGKFIASDLCFILTPKNQKDTPMNLQFYSLLFKEFKDQIVAETKSGTSKEAISLRKFGSYELPYFPIHEQIAINNRFAHSESDKNSFVSKMEESLSLIEKFRTALLIDLIHKNPLESKKNITSHLAESKDKKTESNKVKVPFEYSEELFFSKLGELATISKGKVGIKKAVPGNYPLVTLSQYRLSHTHHQFDTKAVIIPLVSSTGHGHASMKRIHYQEGKFAVGNILCAVIPKNEHRLNTRFLYEYLNQFKEEFFVSKMKGAANVSLNIKAIASTPVPILPINAQLAFENKMLLCDQLTERIINNQRQASTVIQSALKEFLYTK